MKYQIDTVPVWDAYKEGGECPFCAIGKTVLDREIRYFLGESVMEPDQRIEVNRDYFCSEHLHRLYTEGNRLGLGLMTHTYIKNMLPVFANAAEGMIAGAKKDALKPGALRKNLRKSIDESRRIASGCVLCRRLNDNMDRYYYTLLHLYKHDPDFKAAFLASKGMCLEHFNEVMRMACEHLDMATLKPFVADLCEIEQKNLERLRDEVEWFTLKFDYRNQDKPWGNSRDAVKRAVNKMRHTTLTDE